MSKTFSEPAQRQPKELRDDAAFQAAQRAFAEPPATAQPAAAVTPPPPDPAPTAPPAQPSAQRPVGQYRQETKTSVYPSPAAKARLAAIRNNFRVGESIVIEYALERTLGQLTDEEIATQLRAQGHGLRRARPN